jgi:hypothetical protein
MWKMESDALDRKKEVYSRATCALIEHTDEDLEIFRVDKELRDKYIGHEKWNAKRLVEELRLSLLSRAQLEELQ